MRSKTVLTLLLLSLSATLWAHGPQMQITATDGKIVTRDVLTDVYAPLTEAKSVYVMEVLEYGSQWYARPEAERNASDHPTAPGEPTYYSGPGLAYGVEHTFADGSVLTWEFVDGLKSWKGGIFTDAGLTQLQGYRGGAIGAGGELINPTATAVSSDTGPFAKLVFPAIVTNYDEESHSTARWRFLGNGTTTPQGTGTVATEPADGVYLAKFVLSSSNANLEDSDPFWFVMHKNAPWADVVAAASSLGVSSSQVQILGVPEPSTLVSLLVLGGLALSGQKRR